MNISFRCLESRIDTNDTLYGKFSITSVPSGQGNTFANALRRSLFSDLSGLAITHFCITSNPKLDYEFATLPGLTESLLDFSLNLKKIVLTGRLIDNFSENLGYYEKAVTKPSEKISAVKKNLVYNKLFSKGFKVDLASPVSLTCSASITRAKRASAFAKHEAQQKVSTDHYSLLPIQSKGTRSKKLAGEPLEEKIKERVASYRKYRQVVAYLPKVTRSQLFSFSFTRVPSLSMMGKIPSRFVLKSKQPCLRILDSISLPWFTSKVIGDTNQKKKKDVRPSKGEPKAIACCPKEAVGPFTSQGKKQCLQTKASPSTSVGEAKSVLASRFTFGARSEPVPLRSTKHSNQLDKGKNLEKSLWMHEKCNQLPLASIGFLKVKGPATLRASDLILPPGIRCVHPNQYLGTLAADGALSIKFLIATGKGYVIQDEIFYNSLSRANLLPKLSHTRSVVAKHHQNNQFSLLNVQSNINLSFHNTDLSPSSIQNYKSKASLAKTAKLRIANMSLPFPLECYSFDVMSAFSNKGALPSQRKSTKNKNDSFLPPSCLFPCRTNYVPFCKAKERIGLKAGEQSKLLPSVLLGSNKVSTDTSVRERYAVGPFISFFPAKQRDTEQKITTGLQRKRKETQEYIISKAEKEKNTIGASFQAYSEKGARRRQMLRSPKVTYLFASQGKESVCCNLEKQHFFIKRNLSKKLIKKQFIWNSEQNFYPVLPLDATFTPITKTNFQIDVNRDREKNQETIVFEVWTNGSITPKRAIQESSLILAQDFYSLFCSLNKFSNFELWWKRESIGLKNTSLASFADVK